MALADNTELHFIPPFINRMLLYDFIVSGAGNIISRYVTLFH